MLHSDWRDGRVRLYPRLARFDLSTSLLGLYVSPPPPDSENLTELSPSHHVDAGQTESVSPQDGLTYTA